MSAQPTPKPWIATKAGSYEFYKFEWYVDGDGEDVESVAIVNGEANARLIAAAPETAEQRDQMLEALEAVESTLDCGEDGTGWYFIGASLAKEVSDAIAKTKGEA